jgi:hypothetical protein
MVKVGVVTDQNALPGLMKIMLKKADGIVAGLRPSGQNVLRVTILACVA